MDPYIVNQDSSLVAIHGEGLTNGTSVLVYLSTTSEIGQIVTIRDIDGFISSPQSIIISTIECTITGESSTLQIQQRFGYITLQSVSTNVWSIINRNSFVDPSSNYTIKGLAATDVDVTSSLSLTSYLSSTGLIQGTNLKINHNAHYTGTLYTDTLAVNNIIGVTSPSIMDISGSLYNSGDLKLKEQFIIGRDLRFTSSLIANNCLSTLGNINISSGLSTQTFTISGELSSLYILNVSNNLEAHDVFIISTNTSIVRTLNADNINGRKVYANVSRVSSLYFTPSSYIISRTDIHVDDPTYPGISTPVIEIQKGVYAPTIVADGVNTDIYSVSTLNVTSSINSFGLSSIIFSTASLMNINGSLNISSIQAGALVFSTLHGTIDPLELNVFAANNLVTSNLYINNKLYIHGNIDSSQIIGNLYSDSANISSLNIANVSSETLFVSSLNIISSMYSGTNISSLYVQDASIINSQGSIYTSSVISKNTSANLVMSNVSQINSGNLSLVFDAHIEMSNVNATTMFSPSGNINSLQGTHIEFGAPLEFSTISPGGLYLIPSTISGVSTNTPYEYVSGLGTSYSPLHLKASVDRIVYIDLGNISSFSTSYINVSMNYRNDGSSNGNAGFRIHNASTYSTLITFNANPIQGLQTASLSNYLVDRNFNPVVGTYYFTNAYTAPLSDENPNILIGLGESTDSATIQYSYNSGTTWMCPSKTIFTQKGTGVAWSGEKWVATGRGSNSIAYSYTGLVWYGCGSTLFTEGLCVVWNGTMWVAGGSGINTLAYSYDGIAWTGLNNYIFTSRTNGLAWNGYIFIAVGEGNNSIAYSYNGIIWNGAGTDIFSQAGMGITWGKDKWVATGTGTYTIAYSYDGMTWFGASNVLQGGGLCVAWNGSLWIAGGSGTYPLIYSSSGTIWSPVSVPPMSTIQSITWSTSSWILTGSTGGFASSLDGTTWTLNTGTQFTTTGLCVVSRLPLEGTALQSNLLYTTGTNYTLTYSLGGIRWYSVQSLISGVAGAILWNGTLWLAGMLSGYDNILYSYDGMVWIGLGKNLFANRCNSISWNGYIWVATGDAGSNTLAYSYDGINWTGLGTSIFSLEAIGIAWGGGRFIATGTSTNRVWTASSVDGINWIPNLSRLLTKGGKLAYGISLGLTIWVSTGTGTPNLVYSLDGGNTWTPASQQPFSVSSYDVAYNGSQWIICGVDGSGKNVAYSSNGITWTAINVPQASAKGITWSTNAWFLTGGSPSNSIVYKSTDGITWIPISSTFGPADTIVSKQLYPYGTLSKLVSIVCGTNGLAISADGFAWNSIGNPFINTGEIPICVGWNGSTWLIGGRASTPIAYSSNGVTWTSVPLSGIVCVNGIAWSSTSSALGMYICVGEGLNNWATSPDGITWTTKSSGSGGFFSGIAYDLLGGVGGWIAGGDGGMLFSSNGSSWTPRGAGLFTSCYSVQTNGKQYIAGGSGSNTLAVSYDGTLWTGLGKSIFSLKGNGSAFGKNIWVCVGEGVNTLAVSTDGIVWTGLGTSIFSTRGVSVYWNGQTFIASGVGTNTLATSPDGFNWTGLGSSIISAGNKIGGKAILPLERYSVRQSVQYGLECVGGAAPVEQTLLQKFGLTNAWDSSVYTSEGYSDSVYFTFSVATKSTQSSVGLSETPASSTALANLNYSFLFTNTSFSIYESGTQVRAPTAFTMNDTFKILYTGTEIQYYLNTSLLRRVSRSVGNPLYMLTLFYTSGAVIRNIDFHKMYTLQTSAPTPSTNAVVASTTPGLNIALTDPFYMTLLTDLNISNWHIEITAAGTLSNSPTTLYADVYINTTKYFSTNVLSNLSIVSPSTYTLNFDVNSSYIYNPGDTLNFQIKGSRGRGDLYIYSATPTYNSRLTNTKINPNAVKYMEFFHTSLNTGLQTSECSVYISPVSTHTTSYVDSNYGIQMNQSYLQWNNALNGITINNEYNDIETRSLIYTGGLYNASDSNLKHSIEYVDPNIYLESIHNLPLRRFSFINAYRSTFLTNDTKQLGLITSEVEPIFSTMVQPNTGFNRFGLSSIQTLDRTQLRYAHMAATQALIQRVSTLKGRINARTKAT